jgi:hypothetical protein
VPDTTGDRRRIADFLASHGPTHGDLLAARLGMTLGRFWPLINCGWFDIVSGGWDLTVRGRREGLDGPPHAGGTSGVGEQTGQHRG